MLKVTALKTYPQAILLKSNVKGKILRACELSAGHLQTEQTEMLQKQSFEHKLFYSKMSLV